MFCISKTGVAKAASCEWEFDSYNWLVSAEDGSEFCIACRHNRTTPDLSIVGNLASWRLYELAKHRLFYTLIGLGVPLTIPAPKIRATDSHSISLPRRRIIPTLLPATKTDRSL